MNFYLTSSENEVDSFLIFQVAYPTVHILHRGCKHYFGNLIMF